MVKVKFNKMYKFVFLRCICLFKNKLINVIENILKTLKKKLCFFNNIEKILRKVFSVEFLIVFFIFLRIFLQKKSFLFFSFFSIFLLGLPVFFRENRSKKKKKNSKNSIQTKTKRTIFFDKTRSRSTSVRKRVINNQLLFKHSYFKLIKEKFNKFILCLTFKNESNSINNLFSIDILFSWNTIFNYNIIITKPIKSTIKSKQ